MLIGKPDISFIEVDTPENRWCSSGHVGPETFKRSGPEGEEEPTKFFRVVNKDIDIIICEPCLILANYIARLNKNKKE